MKRFLPRTNYGSMNEPTQLQHENSMKRGSLMLLRALRHLPSHRPAKIGNYS